MPKTIIINEEILESGILQDAALADNLPEGIRADILNSRTPLSFRGDMFNPLIEEICVDGYKRHAENEVPDSVSEFLSEIRELETPLRSKLEELVWSIVSTSFGIPQESVDFSIELNDTIDVGNSGVPNEPNDVLNGSPEFLDVARRAEFEEQRKKRMIINVFIAGAASYYLPRLLRKAKEDLDSLNPELYPLYLKCIEANDAMLFCSDGFTVGENGENLGGIVTVELGDNEKKNRLTASALNFPILLYETIKGFLEMCVAHGLPEDNDMKNSVLSSCDCLSYEPWNMRLGRRIWWWFVRAFGEKPETKLIPYILKKVAKTSPKNIVALLQDLYSGEEKSKNALARVYAYAQQEAEKLDFDDRLSDMRNATLIDDNYMYE
jgi:hypothetical protein